MEQKNMALLQEIKKGAQDSNANISDLLRKCMELAVYLKNEELETWVIHELTGYPNKDEIPNYRILNIASYGDFTDAFGGIYRNHPIPTSPLEEPFLDLASREYFGGSISSLVALINNKEGYIRISWPPEVYLSIGNMVYSGLSCRHAWKLIPNSAIAAIIDNVRTKLLKFALEIEKEAPNIDETPNIEPMPISSERIRHIFNTVIMGNQYGLAQGGLNMSEGPIFSVGSQQAGRDIIQAGGNIYQAAGDMTISSSSPAADVIKIVETIKYKIKELDIEEKKKKKISNHLDNAIVELEDESPDKESIADSMKQANEILKETKIAGETIVGIGALIGKVALWLGPIAQSVGLS